MAKRNNNLLIAQKRILTTNLNNIIDELIRQTRDKEFREKIFKRTMLNLQELYEEIYNDIIESQHYYKKLSEISEEKLKKVKQEFDEKKATNELTLEFFPYYNGMEDILKELEANANAECGITNK